MQATWVGGPWDGRTDEVPAGTHAVAIASQKADTWVEHILPVIHTAEGVRIFWHEPQ